MYLILDFSLWYAVDRAEVDRTADTDDYVSRTSSQVLLGSYR